MDELNELSEQLQDRLGELAQAGNEFCSNGQYDQALQVWNEGLKLIPEPQQFYSQSVWFWASIGDIHFTRKEFEKAHLCFDAARGNLSGEGYANPFVMLRLGQACLEIGDEKNALEFMLRAYMFEAEDIFEGDDPKYFAFLNTHIDLNRGSAKK